MEYTCKHCGKEHNNLDDWRKGKLSKIMEFEKVCFNCAFWFNKMEEHDDLTFVIDGTRYHCSGTEDPSNGGTFRGHGGSKFKIKKFNSDEIYKTDNLWCQGEVPDHFKKFIPDNAEFVK